MCLPGTLESLCSVPQRGEKEEEKKQARKEGGGKGHTQNIFTPIVTLTKVKTITNTVKQNTMISGI